MDIKLFAYSFGLSRVVTIMAKKIYKYERPTYPFRTPLLEYLPKAAEMENKNMRQYLHGLLEKDLKGKKIIE